MDIKIYNTHDPINKVSKSLSDVRTIEKVRMLYRENSKTNLRVYLGNVGTLETFTGNYASLTGFGITRYYFITEIGSEKSFIYLDLKEDVLMTYKSDILASNQLVERQEKNKNQMIADNSEPIHADQTFQAYPFGNNIFDKQTINVILCTAGTGTLS